MPVTDREFEGLTDRLDRIESKLDELAKQEAKRAGVEAVLRWFAGSGGLLAWIGALAAILSTVIHHKAGAN
jgi:hypothetical protein